VTLLVAVFIGLQLVRLRQTWARARAQPTATLTPVPVTSTPLLTASPTVMPTATPLPLVTPRAFLTATAGLTLPYRLQEDFDDNANNWLVGTADDDWSQLTRTITDSVYRWELAAERTVGRWCMPDVAAVSDFTLTVTAQWVSGPADAAYGLVFRHTQGNYYGFHIRQDGMFRFSAWYAFEWVPIVDWTESTALRAAAANRLRVVAQGTRFTLAINDTIVAEAADDRLAAGEAGVAVLLNTPGAVVVTFDDFVLETGRRND